MYILKRELKLGIKALLIWIIILAAFILAAMYEYDTMGSEIGSFFDIFPRIILVIIGINPDIDMGNVTGYYAMINYYVLLALIFYSINHGINAVSRELVDKTYEFLFTKPYSRNKILLGKISSGVIYIIVINVATAILSYIACHMVGGVSNTLFLFAITNLVVCLLFFALACFINATNVKTEKATQIIYLFFLVAFVLGIVYDLLENAAFIKFLTPLKYFSAKELMVNGISIIYSILVVILITIFLFLTFHLYNKKDLKAI